MCLRYRYLLDVRGLKILYSWQLHW